MKYDVKPANRIKRIEGQLRGVLRVTEGEQGCKEAITQWRAVRSGVDRTIGVIVSNNLLDCIQNADTEAEMSSTIEEAINLVVKSR